jgi:Tol biopolymer transport system component
MNCHSFNQNDPGQMMFHLRGNIGATMLVRNGVVTKLNTKTKETISNCVYPYWHPSGNYIAFSVNSISQVFHTVKEKRIEVMDSRSDLVIYDINANKLITEKNISSETSFETFPTFSSDGKTLIFCSAKKGTLPDDYNKIKYSLCAVSFDPSTGTIGSRTDTLVSSFKTGKSISFPRPSHDGKYLMFTMSDYGNFSIWHKEADLYLYSFADSTFKPVTSVNSSNTESYHSWSSGSRWFVFSSRRTDGLYTRSYIAWMNDNGEATKPFMLPQKNPDFYDFTLYSFNVPELVKGKVKANGRNMLRTIGSEAKSVTFGSKD